MIRISLSSLCSLGSPNSLLCIRESTKLLNSRLCSTATRALVHTKTSGFGASTSGRPSAVMSSINNLIIKSGPPVKVLVIGGSYGGLSAALNLWDLCTGKEARFKSHAERFKPSVDDSGAKQYPLVSVEISIVDERDGFCESF